MQGNCKLSHPIGRGNNSLYESLTINLAKARTEEYFNIALEEPGTEIGADQKEWWLSRKYRMLRIPSLIKGRRVTRRRLATVQSR